MDLFSYFMPNVVTKRRRRGH